MRRVGRTAGAALAAALVAALVGCVPKFPDGASLSATPTGSGALLSWPAAEELDTGQTIGAYRVDVDGAEVARVPGTRRSCTLAGLAAGPHQVAVTAYDTAGEWSGAGSALKAVVTAPEPAATGSALDCTVSPTDDLVPGFDAYYPSMSDDGRFVAFTSRTPAAPGDTAGTFDVFVHDRISGATTQVTNGDRSTLRFTIAGGGRFVAFQSDATNLIPGQVTTGTNVFVWDGATRQTARVPVPGNASIYGSVLSDDGRYVAVLAGSVGSPSEYVRWDRATGSLASLTDGRRLEPPSDVSSDGRYVVFGATDLSGSSPVRSMVRWDAETGTTEQIVVPGRGSFESLAMSDDGDVGVLTTQVASGYAAWVWERSTGEFTDLTALEGGDHSWLPSMSDDGRFVTMEIDGPGIAPRAGAFTWDRSSRQLRRWNLSGPIAAVATMSPDGRTVVFQGAGSGGWHLYATTP